MDQEDFNDSTLILENRSGISLYLMEAVLSIPGVKSLSGQPNGQERICSSSRRSSMSVVNAQNATNRIIQNRDFFFRGESEIHMKKALSAC